ncbi:hypothetical protein [Bifidobacterium callitrichidarum]|uniref:Uncharacterized protein n=1 Tax=Bifidobacterium callitrichidarum TaxID=2052941 RepID=A0A2U2N0T8_9BIFI|nr:hypothetical protein [Bifidobacterium callitrichidarum]PWG62667.1 hypothetical protein DF196_11960 [Bifidobacterium callitrichidarum]
MNSKKIIAIIAAIVLVAGLATGWVMWRRHVTGNEKDTEQSQTVDKKKPSKKTETQSETDKQNTEAGKPTQTDRAALELAIQYEKNARDWGTDSTVNPATYAQQDAAAVVAALRTPALGDNPLTALISFKPDKDAGPTVVSIPCQRGYQTSCSTQLTMGDWWNKEALGTGTRWVKGPVAKVEGDNIRVTGTVRSILVQDTDTYGAGDYSAITPAWKNYEVNDLLTIRDNKVASVKHETSDPWWIDPWMQEWDDTMANNLTTATRYAIPVKGQPDMGLSHYGESPLLGAPQTGGDDGVDWSAWKDLKIPAGGGSAGQPASQCQNPLPDGSCPSSF